MCLKDASSLMNCDENQVVFVEEFIAKALLCDEIIPA